MEKWSKAAAAAAIALGPLCARAEPTPLVNKLMNEPVSLFTLGLYRLGLDAAEQAPKAGFSLGAVDYDWDSNEIRIQAFTLFNSPLVKQCTSDQACEKALREALTTYANNFAIGPTSNGTWMEFVTGKFTQLGYTPKKFHDGKALDAAVDDLARIVKISGTIRTAQRTYECRRELKSVDVFCSSKANK